MALAFDHLVIGAADLGQGADWALRVLRVVPPVGGAHPTMGTHNLLARLPSGYLEIIAIDPAAPTPTRPRWYGLDSAATQAAIAERPRPIAWVLASDDIEADAARAGWDVGEILDASRGDLSWRIAVPRDGLVVEGVLPALIEWPEALGRRAPTDRMAELGLALRGLRLKHPEPARIQAALETVGAAAAMSAAGVGLRVLEAETPSLEAAFTPENIEIRV